MNESGEISGTDGALGTGGAGVPAVGDAFAAGASPASAGVPAVGDAFAVGASLVSAGVPAAGDASAAGAFAASAGASTVGFLGAGFDASLSAKLKLGDKIIDASEVAVASGSSASARCIRIWKTRRTR